MHVPHLPPKALKRLNACRIFLQVLTLADIRDGVAPTFYPAPFKESGTMIGAVPTHGHIKLGPRQRHGEFGARLYVFNFAQPVRPTDCRDQLESDNTMGLSTRSGHSLLTCLPTTCFNK